MRRCRNIFKHGAPTGELLFDVYGIGIAGFSFRKLSNDYEGYCLKVRRSSDDTTQDIGFVDDSLDIDSLLSFVGSGSGYVHTWYNQGSESVNFVQTTNSKQPRIVDSGNIEADGNKPCMRFLGGQCLSAGDNFDRPEGESSIQRKYSAHCVGSMSGSNQVLFGKASVYQSDYASWFVTTFPSYDGLYPAAADTVIKGTRALHTIHSNYLNDSLDNVYYVKDGQQKNSSAWNKLYTNANNFKIGAGDYGGGGDFFYMTGICQELVIYKGTDIPLYSDIDTDINSFYSIY